MRVGTGKGKVLFLLLLTIGALSACASEELLQETPVEFRLEGEEVLEKTLEELLPEELGQATQESATEEDAFSFLSENVNYYAYNSLNELEQVWYKDMEKCLGEMRESIVLDKTALKQGLGEDDINRVFQCVLIDHPEIFYVDGYTYKQYTRGDKTVSIEFAGSYNVDVETAKAKKAAIEQAADEMLAGIVSLDGDYEKMKAIYETIILGTDYEMGAPDNQNIYSVFVNHKSVCQGYAKATQYLCNLAGIECTLVMGTVENGMGHAWNLVNLDGNYYYVDTTWGDISYELTEEDMTVAAYAPAINYDYLCITTRKLLDTHVIESEVPMPECVAMQDNYYVRENAYFTEYNVEQMQALFRKMQEQGRSDITVMCEDGECFQAVKAALIDEQEIFNYLGEQESIGYSINEAQLSMTFWVTNE